MKDNCLICKRIADINKNKNPYFISELSTGYVVLGDYQFQQGYTLFLCKKHAAELHELTPEFKSRFLLEMSKVAEAIYKAFNPKKLNYELLGNTDCHLHWHIFPRYKSDKSPKQPIWTIPSSIRNAKKYKPTEEEIEQLKKKILKYL